MVEDKSWEDKLINRLLERKGGKRTLLNNILRRNANWIGHILIRNRLLYDIIEGQATEVIG